MRVYVWGLVTACLLSVLAGVNLQHSEVFGQRPNVPPFELPKAQLIALSSEDPGGVQQVVLVDPHKQVMGVYHINRQNGEITLKSVRSVQWDMLMEEFNGTSPLPREIRSLLPGQSR